MENLKGTNAIIYVRVSTKDQKDYGNSLEVQKKALEIFCANNGLNILELFQDDFSAKNFNRPDFKRLREFAKANKNRVDFLLVQKWGRFSRNLALGLLEIDKFKKLGIEINSIENWFNYENSEYIILQSLYLSTPEVENSKIGERTTAGTREALKQGRYVNMQPKGYMSGKDAFGKTLMQPDPKFAPMITDIFEDYSTGLYSQQDILDKYSKKGLDIKSSALRRLLENPLYMGKVKVPAYKNDP